MHIFCTKLYKRIPSPSLVFFIKLYPAPFQLLCYPSALERKPLGPHHVSSGSFCTMLSPLQLKFKNKKKQVLQTGIGLKVD